MSFRFEHRQRVTTEPIQSPEGGILPAGHRWFEMASEDWELSRQLSEKKVPYCATRAVKLRHVGHWHWSNQADYFTPIPPGGQETDELYMQKVKQDLLEKLMTEAYERGRRAGISEASTAERVEWDRFVFAAKQDANRPGEL